MRDNYHLSLESLSFESSVMCKVASNCLSDANRALREADAVRAGQVVASEQLLNQMVIGAEAQALELLSLQAPVASELRAVIGSLWIVADLQQMGSLAVLIARACLRSHPRLVVAPLVSPIIEEMGDLAVQLADQAVGVLRDRDVQRAGLIAAGDRRVDELQREMFSILLGRGWDEGVETAVNVALVGRHLERFADHAVDVARRVVFVVTGDPGGVASRRTTSEQRSASGRLASRR